jgi:lipopolysaccharide transport system ATP-binding protein
MSSDAAAISVRGVSKCYPVYARPADRLRQFVMPRLRRAAGAAPRRYYDEYWALRDVSFDVYPGEQLGVVGRNGAGKSTLLQIICGTLTPTTGTVAVSGRVAALLELGAGFNPELTGAENIRLNGSVLGLSAEQLDQRFESIVAFADIPGFIEQPVKSYSSGMFMRLAFSVAVHVEPDVLVVDEALSVGDEAYQRKCHARIKTLRDRGTTILFVSHSAGHVTEVCDRAVLLDRGRLLCVGSAKDVVSRYQKLLYSKVGSDYVDSALSTGDGGWSNGSGKTTLPVARRPRLNEAYWDEGLVPESTVVYSSQDCSIHDAHLENLVGDRVNVLRPGEEYVYTYCAVFDRPAAGVRFGMMVRSLTGIELAGAVSHPEGKPLEVVESGVTVRVRFRFRNLLNAGTYFLNAGVVGLQGEEENFLVRYMDVAMFRVMRDPEAISTGFASLDVEPSLELL